MAYKTLPVDEETYKKVRILCRAYEMGERGQGALVRKLVNTEYEKLVALKLPTVEPAEQDKIDNLA